MFIFCANILPQMSFQSVMFNVIANLRLGPLRKVRVTLTFGVGWIRSNYADIPSY